MPARKVLASWAALYNGSFGGLEDKLSGTHWIVALLFFGLIAERIIISAIGNLYEITPTRTVKMQTEWPMFPYNLSDGQYDPNNVNDILQLNINGGMCSQMQQDGIIPDPQVNVTCDDNGCVGKGFGAIHPLSSVAYGLHPPKFDNSNLVVGDRIQGRSLAAIATVKCSTEDATFDVERRAPPAWLVSLVGVSMNTTDGRALIGGDSNNGITFNLANVSYPELGLLPVATLDSDNPVTDSSGRFQFVVFHKGLSQNPRGFVEFEDPSGHGTIGVTLCSVAMETGDADIEVKMMSLLPIATVALTESTLLSVKQEIPVGWPSRNRGVLDVMRSISYWASCYFSYCPSTPHTVPSFDLGCRLLPDLPVEGQFDFQNMLGQAVRSIVKMEIMGIVAIMAEASRNMKVPDVTPAIVFTESEYSRLETTDSCVRILLIGAGTSLSLIVLHITTFVLSRKSPAIRRGLHMTESIYSLLAVFDKNLVGIDNKQFNSSSFDIVDPINVRQGMRRHTLKLDDDKLMLHKHGGKTDKNRLTISKSVLYEEVEASCNTQGSAEEGTMHAKPL
ncbi:uncharacterized protein EV422DRAFT_566530 [Fimicolochytrium jonesii]|uniref:uncharacterized protein n=1 Tax=Fimicolochytrium jonesii TaxID=1396493 RepID=UPI0022FE9C96|nr:uncharacterized protein EV422DRAFT_566530 [Fimicolochytrium jonesii]KAI8822095.1 hypothetical protein EV422DRAFT_566530 [Fimicolochytrium jonesii]